MPTSRSPRKPVVPKQPPLLSEEEIKEIFAEVEQPVPETEEEKTVEEVVEEVLQTSDPDPEPQPVPPPAPIEPTGVIFMGDEDRKLIKKYNKYIVKKLNIGGNRSFRV